MPEIDSVVVEDLDAVRAVVGDEDLLAVVDDDAVRELQMFGASKFVKDVAHLEKIKNGVLKRSVSNSFIFNQIL